MKKYKQALETDEMVNQYFTIPKLMLLEHTYIKEDTIATPRNQLSWNQLLTKLVRADNTVHLKQA